MKNWKEYPYLFANGKFKIQVGETICDIIAWNTHGRFSLYGDEERKEIKLMHCTLIARKIEDMTEEEFLNCAKIMNEPVNNESAQSFQQFINEEGWLPSNVFLYILSIGVYPFSQSHFETGEVIDIKTL